MAETPPASTSYRFGGWLLVPGCSVLIIGIALYATLPQDLGTPAAEATYATAQREAVAVRPQMERAGRVIYLGDLLADRRRGARAPTAARRLDGDIERVGWPLVFVSVVPAFVFDSLFGAADAPSSRPRLPALGDYFGALVRSRH